MLLGFLLDVGELDRGLLFYLNLVVNGVVQDCTQGLLVFEDQAAPAVGQPADVPGLVGGVTGRELRDVCEASLVLWCADLDAFEVLILRCLWRCQSLVVECRLGGVL